MVESLEDFSAQVAAAAALAAQQGSATQVEETTIGIPGETVTVPSGAEGDGPTLEEQAAAQEAANHAETAAPIPGADIALPEELGDAFKGKTVSDLIGMLANAQKKITEQGQQLASGARPDGTVVPGAGTATAPQTLEDQVAAGKKTPAQQTEAVLAHYANLFNQQGSLSEADVNDITAKTGLPTHMVTGWIQGEAAKAQLAAQEIYSTVGGEAKYMEMLGWMEKNVPDPQLQQFNRALATEDVQQIKFAVEAMKGAWEASGGGPPTFFQGASPAVTAAAPFGSWAEVQKAMGTAEYETDPAYRAEVERRLAASPNL